MLNKIKYVTVSMLAVSSVAAYAQTPAQPVTGNMMIARQCDGVASASALGFTFAARLSRASSATQGFGTSAGAATAERHYSISSGNTVYTDEPLVGAVDENGPASGKILPGDLIARVNGYAITTAQGSDALRSAKAGTSLVLTVRRGENLVAVTIIPNAVRCPMMLGGAYARGGFSTGALNPSGTGMARIGQLSPSTSAVIASGSLGPMYRTAPNAGWLGMGFDCTDCGQRLSGNARVWYFTQPPVIYNVDTGSPADNAGIRRGDVLLRVDGKDVTSAAAGERLAAVNPGEKLNLTYRRGGKSKDVSVRVAPSPISLRASTVAGQLLPSAKDVRPSTNELRIRDLLSQTERSKVAQEANMHQLEIALQSAHGAAFDDARGALSKLRASQELQSSRQKLLLSQVLESEQDGTRRTNMYEQMKRAAVEAQAPVVELMVDSAATFMKSTARDQRLRYSGSVGGADVEVRGPGSVSVQGDGDDLIIITGDAIIRIKTRKSR